jgi:hypothetical protein
MQANQIVVRDAQELFDEFLLQPSIHQDDIDSPNTVKITEMQHKFEPISHRRSSESDHSINVDEEIAMLISIYTQAPRRAAQARTGGPPAVIDPIVALPPAVRFCRASRKTAAKLSA